MTADILSNQVDAILHFAAAGVDPSTLGEVSATRLAAIESQLSKSKHPAAQAALYMLSKHIAGTHDQREHNKGHEDNVPAPGTMTSTHNEARHKLGVLQQVARHATATTDGANDTPENHRAAMEAHANLASHIREMIGAGILHPREHALAAASHHQAETHRLRLEAHNKARPTHSAMVSNPPAEQLATQKAHQPITSRIQAHLAAR